MPQLKYLLNFRLPHLLKFHLPKSHKIRDYRGKNMSNFSEIGEAKALTGLVEARFDPSQSPSEKETEEDAITRELNVLTPEELQNTITEFKQINTGFCSWYGINATENKSATGEVSSIDFAPLGILPGNSEPFNIKLK